MNIFECIKSSFFNVFSNKMRTFLTMLGIIIGISSVITIVAIGNGSQAAIEEEFESFGTGTLTVSLVGSRDIDTRDLLKMDDYYLLRDLDGIEYIAPTYSGSNAYVKLYDPTETNRANVTGSTADYRYINNDTVLYGRYISDNDVEMRTNVCVIQDTTAQKVFGYCNEDVIGEKIKIKSWKGTTKLTVIGITENTNASSENYSDEYPEEVIMPISTCMKVFTGDTIDGISIVPEDASQSEALQEDFHGNEDKYYIQDSTDTIESINSILSYVTLFIGFVAAISLIVGGIGVMNIMMVTVTERTREIGIRKAIGAKNRDIRIQFITEAIILTGMGGFLGLGVSPVMSITSIVGAVGVSMLIGIIFGVAPANKAAMLDPIEALRFE